MGKVNIDCVLPFSNKTEYNPRNCEVCPLLATGQVDWCNYYEKRINRSDTRPSFCQVKSIVVEE